MAIFNSKLLVYQRVNQHFMGNVKVPLLRELGYGRFRKIAAHRKLPFPTMVGPRFLDVSWLFDHHEPF